MRVSRLLFRQTFSRAQLLVALIRGLTPRKNKQARGAGDSIKPGVKRSGPPGNLRSKITEAREAAGRRIIMIDVCNCDDVDHMECAGRAKRRRRFGLPEPMKQTIQSGVALRLPPHSKFYRPLRGLDVFFLFLVLGFRYAPPQALCWRPLCGLWRVLAISILFLRPMLSAVRTWNSDLSGIPAPMHRGWAIVIRPLTRTAPSLPLRVLTLCCATRLRLCNRNRFRPLRGLDVFFLFLVLGFRCAPPQALCCRPLRGLN